MKLLAYQTAGIAAVCVESGAPGMEDGLDAFVVAGRGSPGAFAARVAQALRDRATRASIAASARARALKRSDPGRIALEWERVLDSARYLSAEAGVYVAGS